MTDQALPTSPIEAPAGNRLRLILIGAGALLALVGLYAVVISPLLGAEPTALDQPAGQGGDALIVTDDAVTDGAAAQAEAEAAPPPATPKVFAARDPFQQLVTVPVLGSALATGTAPIAALPSATTPAVTAVTATAGLPATRADSAVVKLISITASDGAPQATVTVDGASHTVAEGQQFATSFRVLDIAGDCATLAFGDRRVTLCAGEEIRK